MKCPNNCTDGFIHGLGCGPKACLKPVRIPCDICKGTGELPDDITYDPERGRGMKQDRKSRRVTLRNEAGRLGIKPSAINRMERGFFPQ